ncbi:hypothetical protein GCM10009639_09100 [Kitasatospora putterlickiae]|uniref:Uncharacterized protein n=1 Tax=Kitasatospora putterlickiae TaxID=221725 RepID=A0ABN1XPC2_9ACTN
MRIASTIGVVLGSAVLALGGTAAYADAATSAGRTTAPARTGSLAAIPSYCVPGSDSNYFGVRCNTQKIYKVKAYCDSSDGRSTTLTGNEASNNGWSTIHCNTLGSGWHYRQNSGIVLLR